MTLTWNRYGKARIRLVKVRRAHEPHELVDLTIDVQLEGAFDSVYVDGDNRPCLPTDTMKNTVYALARQDPIEHVEAFALRLASASPPSRACRRFASRRPSIPGSRFPRAGAHPRAFVQPGREWTTEVILHERTAQITSGLANLVVMKTADSGFEGFPRDGSRR